jgi:hypothetical protein
MRLYYVLARPMDITIRGGIALYWYIVESIK